MQDFLYDIIRSPIHTEKATIGTEAANKYTFKVAPKATKLQIKAAFKKIFGADALKVNVLSQKPKAKVFKGRKGARDGYKKAVVTFAKGKKLEFVTGA